VNAGFFLEIAFLMLGFPLEFSSWNLEFPWNLAVGIWNSLGI
jgi:hypothetical protein